MADSENVNFLLQCLESTHTKPDFVIVGCALNIEAGVACAWFNRLKNTTQRGNFGKIEQATSRPDAAAAETLVASHKAADQSNEEISGITRKRKRPRRKRVRQDHDEINRDLSLKYDKEVKDSENQFSAGTKDVAERNTHTICEGSPKAHDSESGTESDSGPSLKDIGSSLARKRLDPSSFEPVPRPIQPRKKAIKTTSQACRPSVAAAGDQSSGSSNNARQLFSVDILKYTSLGKHQAIRDELERFRTGGQVQLTRDTNHDIEVENIPNHNIGYPTDNLEHACDVHALEDTMKATKKCNISPDESRLEYLSAGDTVVQGEVASSSDATPEKGAGTGTILQRITSWLN